jgi:spore maturation protein CgeB
LCRALVRRRHQIIFFEHDVPYYARHRDLTEIPGGRLVLYSNWDELLPLAESHLADADVGMVTSYCPDGVHASEVLLHSPVRLRTFYDLDTPVTLQRWRDGQPVAYIGTRGLRDFDLVLSYTGGVALRELQTRLGARRVAPLYGSVDPRAHQPGPSVPHYRADLSYLGTYAEDRQAALNILFVEPARQRPRLGRRCRTSSGSPGCRAGACGSPFNRHRLRGFKGGRNGCGDVESMGAARRSGSTIRTGPTPDRYRTGSPKVGCRRCTPSRD